MRYIDAIRERGRDANPFFCLMGIDPLSSGDGKGALLMPVTPSMHNGEGWLQGGIFTALADEAMVLAIYSLLDENETISTISESTQFLHGVKEGIVEAEGRVVKRGRRVAFAEGEVRQQETGKVLARSEAAYAIVRRET